METSAQAAVSLLHAHTTALIQNVAALGNSFLEGSPSAALDSQMEQFWAKQRFIHDQHLDLNFTVAVLAQTKSGALLRKYLRAGSSRSRPALPGPAHEIYFDLNH